MTNAYRYASAAAHDLPYTAGNSIGKGFIAHPTPKQLRLLTDQVEKVPVEVGKRPFTCNYPKSP
ncbi:MAG: hypothetical protein AAGJ46_09715 [Planctomycetota bacterium]